MKYTTLERNWVMYDVGNSALVLLNTSVVPIYFDAINTAANSAELVTAWANAQTIASLVVALLMPVLGSLADFAGNKIKFFLGFFLTGLVLCLAQALPMGAMPFLIVYVLCTIGLNSSMTFYDAMLPDVTTDERMDAVSSSGYAWGYVGSCVPFIVCIALIMGGPAVLGLDMLLCTRLSFVITGAWWLAFTLPLLRNVLCTCLVLAITGALKVFDLPWVMFGAGMPREQGWLTGTYMYDQTFNRGNVDYGSAIAMLIR